MRGDPRLKLHPRQPDPQDPDQRPIITHDGNPQHLTCSADVTLPG